MRENAGDSTRVTTVVRIGAFLMRRIKINYQEGESQPSVAIDNASGEIILRHNKLDELESVCRKLRRHIVSNSAKWIQRGPLELGTHRLKLAGPT
jgi:hypothetical protein